MLYGSCSKIRVRADAGAAGRWRHETTVQMLAVVVGCVSTAQEEIRKIPAATQGDSFGVNKLRMMRPIHQARSTPVFWTR